MKVRGLITARVPWEEETMAKKMMSGDEWWGEHGTKERANTGKSRSFKGKSSDANMPGDDDNAVSPK